MVDGPPEPPARRRKHSLFGLTLESDFAFESRLAPGSGTADLAFAAAAGPNPLDRSAKPIYESPLRNARGESLARLYRLPEGDLLRFGRSLDYRLTEDRIEYHLGDAALEHLVEVRLLGPVLAYWLERSGIVALHASAVVAEGAAVAFLASNQGGKSGLAAAMMAAGAPLLTDDLLPLEASEGGYLARPGYPQMRLWPDALRQFVPDPEERAAMRLRLGKHWVPVGAGGIGSFHGRPAPLRAIYLPRRLDRGGPAEVLVEAVAPSDAAIELLRCSFSPYIVEAVGLQPARLDLVASLVRQLPLRRITYPSGYAALPRVVDAVLADLQ